VIDIVRISSFAWHKSLKKENFEHFRVFGESPGEGKFELKLWRIISREILAGQPCELDH